ncbi:MAG: hypothetical protein HY907_12185 [Deltaproteobacteria bacterium]|nr:hypothetical protein [Deltaproteobacteria bacterium]
MSLRTIGGIIAVASALLLSISAISKGWYTAKEGEDSMGAGPMWVEECDGSQCESQMLMKGARGPGETWAAAGLAYAGLASVTSLLLLIFGIIAFTGSGGKGAGITALVFAMLSNGAAGAFVATKPASMAFLTTGLGVYLSSLGGMLGIAFGIVMIVAAKKAKAAAAAPAGYGAPPGYPVQGAPPQGYGAPPGYPPPGAPPQGQPGPGPGMPPQG